MKRNVNKLRLILFEECHRNCDGCCNKDWDLPNLPVCRDFQNYDSIMLTGGEPMLHPEVIVKAIGTIRMQTKAPIILYTSLVADKEMLGKILDCIEGITVTLHTPEDITPFLEFDRYYAGNGNMSFRLNIFRGVGHVPVSPRWKVKDNITWIKDCPLPLGETLMRFAPEDLQGKR
ncbi:hypothetical protein DS742_17410 [Lacrimispora amygdalina]|uniref:4Fe-4S cluster-binding domain-containing protein n=1 Tax=Lacrimispora amygdalina TaxID=253257 RepID=A0A3E2N9B4_9FIRM|nr:hypothetical protein [Clostridium indicum]RFZ77593.1 hypothetical protein DS742_17410 [Clostridium indicum]